MPLDARDPAHLWDMLDAARTLQSICAGFSNDDYLQDRSLQLAVERSLEIIGEAARRVSDAFKRQHPEIPWHSIIAQRNIIVHEYDEVRQDRLWRVVTVHIPTLVTTLEPLLPPLPPPDA